MITNETTKELSNVLSELFDYTFKLTIALQKENLYTEEQAEKFSEIKQRMWLLQKNLNMPQE